MVTFRNFREFAQRGFVTPDILGMKIWRTPKYRLGLQIRAEHPGKSQRACGVGDVGVGGPALFKCLSTQ